VLPSWSWSYKFFTSFSKINSKASFWFPLMAVNNAFYIILIWILLTMKDTLRWWLLLITVVIYRLSEKGADVNMQNFRGDTALMVLLERNKCEFEIVKVLVESGSNLNLVNKFKQNALFTARRENQKEAFKFILEKDAKNLNDQKQPYFIH